MNMGNKQNGNFLLLSEQNNIADIIDYLQSELKIKQIKCFVVQTPVEHESIAPLKADLIVEKIVINGINHEIIDIYADDIQQRTKTVLEESLYEFGATNMQRYHNLIKQLTKLDEILDCYFYKNPLFCVLSDIEILQVYKKQETRSSFFALPPNEHQRNQVNFAFRSRQHIFRIVHRLVLDKCLEYSRFIDETGRNYGWSPITKELRKSNPELEIYELAFALANSEKLIFKNGKGQEEFLKEFLNFFDLPPDGVPTSRSVFNNRTTNISPFLQELMTIAVENKPESGRQRKSKIKTRRE